jgi:hypothetical protein
MKTRVKIRTIGAALLAVTGLTSYSQGLHATGSDRPSERLKAYLRSYFSQGGKIAPDKTARIAVCTVNTIDGKPEEDIVYVSGRDWCGSGGCTMLILQSNESAIEVLGRVTIVQLPIRLLPSQNYGHPDIGVSVQGGGILRGYEAVLSFDGESYPSNPSVPPARKAAVARGRVIIANLNESVPLYD